eukprot:4067891-Ditylum_brightwellii.AAC.1
MMLVLDSGANNHMCNNKEYFTTFQQSTIDFVILGHRKTQIPVKASKGTCTSLDALNMLMMIIP